MVLARSPNTYSVVGVVVLATSQVGQILGDVSLLCGAPHIGVVEARGPVRLAAVRADAFVTMEALKQSSAQVTGHTQWRPPAMHSARL